MNVQSLSQYLDERSQQDPDKVALIDDRAAISFAALRQRVEVLAGWMQHLALARGDRVIVLMSNSIDLVACFWATQRCGAVYVPLHPETKAEKLAWIADDCTASLMIVDAEREEEALRAASAMKSRPQRWVANDAAFAKIARAAYACTLALPLSLDLASIIYTSGSTGHPKGVMLTQRNMIAASQSVAHYLQLDARDRIYCALPLSFDYGLHQITMAALTGATVIIEKNFSRPLFALNRLVQQGANVFPLVPTMVSLIARLSRRFDFSSVKTVTSTSAALHPSDIATLTTVFPQARLFSMYGLTECHRCTWLDPSELSVRTQSVGKAIPGTELWVVDADGEAHRCNATGELVIRGETVMRGYWNNPQKTAEKLRPGRFPGESVLYTGDRCRLDEDGFLYFLSRMDDVLNACGEKVAPREVESIISTHPHVVQVAVVGIPHAVYGDEIVAWIETQQAMEPRQMHDWCKDRMEHHLIPHRFLFCGALPKNSNQKIDRLRLCALSQTSSPTAGLSGEKHAEL
ncbi:long-chain fatty acid--CoA ligase [Lonsdalea populi]|uniref:Long-chain fatty acid--CoA ligase n=1 Tax=Lonsdalea populi TaxID=1172565 RepID=A0A3N0UDC2_9GAMM|nr:MULTISPECIES: class I adenylate-forming enzyme family protein [Lonsdalea]RAT17912.1 long-chain fatty acid--CoA ligase [Lonsdalea quercina]RAT28661.1 long-chain fatty acid--CoA ligase [Lonsdalea populi]RAT37809.1 long-chain fatty acid--CoA ligase [Lonsdalea populi]RAT48527.1 long-chain fatty acid--CoA ligase [Lonsdalea populi]RAT52262.1 long-chain fatty acid--CoA ligase [Lonsdalea populi]